MVGDQQNSAAQTRDTNNDQNRHWYRKQRSIAPTSSFELPGTLPTEQEWGDRQTHFID